MKASSLSGAGGKHDTLNVLWEDTERVFCKLWRDDAEGDRHAFTPVLTGAEHPTLESINRLTREYELKDYLDGAWALRPVEIVRERGRTMLIVEYTAGEPLDRLIQEPMEIGRFLRLAVALAAALSRLHGRGLIHKDIKPANVLADAATGQVWLTGFGTASRLRASANRPNLPSSLRERLPIWRPSKRDE